MKWGKWRENGIWTAPMPSWRLLGPAYNDRLFYLALGRLRIRLMQPWRNA